MIPFVKMQSLGNDSIILAQDIEISQEEVKMMAHRHYGIGCDQIMVLGSPMRIWNQDGTEAMACGNGTRCVIEYFNPPYGESITLHGPVGPLKGWKTTDGLVHVQQGLPLVGTIFHKEIPFLMNTLDLNAYGCNHGVPVSIGNPHLVIKGSPPEASSSVWQALAHHPAFSEGVNVSFVYKDSEIRVTTWEKGAGFTLGCGSAACAVAAVLFQIPSFTSDFFSETPDNPLSLWMPGGEIRVSFTQQGLVHAALTSKICWGWWQHPKSKDTEMG